MVPLLFQFDQLPLQFHFLFLYNEIVDPRLNLDKLNTDVWRNVDSEWQIISQLHFMKEIGRRNGISQK